MGNRRPAAMTVAAGPTRLATRLAGAAFRVPRPSLPFFRAALLDAAGIGVLGATFGAFAGVIACRLGASEELLTVLSIAPFLGLLASAPMSRLAHRHSWARLAAFSRLAGRVTMLAFLPVTGPAVFTLLASGIWALQTAGAGFFDSLMQAHVRPRARAPLLRWMRIVTVLASLPLPYFIGRALDNDLFLYRWLLPLAAVLTSLACLPLARLRKRPLETHSARAGSPGLLAEVHLLRADRSFLVFMLVYFLGTLGEKLTGPITPPYLVNLLHLTNTQIACSTAIVAPAASILGYFLWTFLLARVHPLRLLTFVMTVKAIRPALWALAPASPSPLLLLTVAESSFAFLIAGLDLAGFLCVLRMVRGQQGPLYLGIHYGFMGIRGLLGPFLGLWLYRAGMSMPAIFWLTTYIVLAGGLALWLFTRRHLARSPA